MTIQSYGHLRIRNIIKICFYTHLESGQVHYCGYGLSFAQENPSQLFHLFTLPSSTVTSQSLQCGLHYCIALARGGILHENCYIFILSS